MATYGEYRQELASGEEGSTSKSYIEYDVSPSFGTPLKAGDTIKIKGYIYFRLSRVYKMEAKVMVSDGVTLSIGSLTKAIAQRTLTGFEIEAKVTEDLINALSNRAFNLPLYFVLYQDTSYTETKLTSTVEGQEFRVLKYLLPPEISMVYVQDSTGAYSHFGGMVNEKSKLMLRVSYSLDPEQTNISVKNVRLKAKYADGAYYNMPIESFSEGASGNLLSIKTAFNLPRPASGTVNSELITFEVEITDTSENTGVGETTGAINVYPYDLIYIERANGALLFQRYSYVLNDYGEQETILSPNGEHIMSTFFAYIPKIAGKNTWTITAMYAESGSDAFISIPVQSGEDGRAVLKVNSTTVFPDTISFSPSKNYTLRIVVQDFFETVIVEDYIYKANAYFHITKSGVAIGGRSTATPTLPKFESFYPFYPYEGIATLSSAVKSIPLSFVENSKFTTYDEYSNLSLAIYGNVAHLSGVIKPTESIPGSTELLPICYIPEQYAPSGNNLVFIQQGSSLATWMLTVHPKDYYLTPLEVSFSRYRSGSSSATAPQDAWLPFSAIWIITGQKTVQTAKAIAGMALAGQVKCGEV